MRGRGLLRQIAFSLVVRCGREVVGDLLWRRGRVVAAVDVVGVVHGGRQVELKDAEGHYNLLEETCEKPKIIKSYQA